MRGLRPFNSLGCSYHPRPLGNAVLGFSLALGLALATGLAQETPLVQGTPPELKRLADMIGIWDTAASYRPTPDAPAFEGRSVETTRWSANRQFLITDQLGLTRTGWEDRLLIISWDPVKKEYKLIEVNPAGENIEMTMEVKGKVQKILSYRPFEGRLIRTELTVETVSPFESKFRWECTDQGKTWLFGEGISKKRSP